MLPLLLVRELLLLLPLPAGFAQPLATPASIPATS
jgi:hypothetical protein